MCSVILALKSFKIYIKGVKVSNLWHRQERKDKIHVEWKEEIPEYKYKK
jgi:hypothetical protein